MKIHTWLTSGLAARDTSNDPSDYLVWFPANLDSLTVAPLVGESASVPFYFTPKTSALAKSADGIVLLGVPLGDLEGSWLSLIHISEPTRRTERSRMPSSA